MLGLLEGGALEHVFQDLQVLVLLVVAQGLERRQQRIDVCTNITGKNQQTIDGILTRLSSDPICMYI